MDHAGIVLKSRSTRGSKYTQRRTANDKDTREQAAASTTIAVENKNTPLPTTPDPNWTNNNPWFNADSSAQTTIEPIEKQADHSLISQEALNFTGVPPINDSTLWMNNMFSQNNQFLNVDINAFSCQLPSTLSNSPSESANDTPPFITQSHTRTMTPPNSQPSPQNFSLLMKPFNPSDAQPEKMENDKKSLAPLSQQLVSTNMSVLSTDELLDFCVSKGLSEPSCISHDSVSDPLDITKSDMLEFADAHFVRIIDSNGELASRRCSYYQSCDKLHLQCGTLITYPGGHKAVTPHSTLDLTASLYPALPSWQDSDYEELRNEAMHLLLCPASAPLIRIALNDLKKCLPIFQCSEVHQCVTVLMKNKALEVHWTAVQTRQRLALLLLLCATGATETAAIGLPVGEKIEAAIPWEFGERCYLLARALLAPQNTTFSAEEKTLELMQALLLMHMFLVQCGDLNGAWPAMVDGLSVILHLINQPTMQLTSNRLPTLCIIEREMVKRNLWALFILEMSYYARRGSPLPCRLLVEVPKLELPRLLDGLVTQHGHTDFALKQETFMLFCSIIDLSNLYARILTLDLSKLTVSDDQTRSAAEEWQGELHSWLSQTPCVVSGNADHEWHTTQMLGCRSIYQACKKHLNLLLA